MIILSEVSQKEKDKYHVMLLYVESKIMTQMSLSVKQRQTQT